MKRAMSTAQKPMARQKRKKPLIDDNRPGSGHRMLPMGMTHSASGGSDLQSMVGSVKTSKQQQQEPAGDSSHGKTVAMADMLPARPEITDSDSNMDPCHRLVELEQMRLAADKTHMDRKEKLRRKHEIANRGLEENNRIKMLRLKDMRAEADRIRTRITLAQLQFDRNASEKTAAKAAIERISKATREAKREIERLKIKKEELDTLLSERQKTLDGLKHEKGRARSSFTY